jgi:crescentin
MNKFTHLFGRKRMEPTDELPALPLPKKGPNGEGEPQAVSQAAGQPISEESFSLIGSRIGEENEALRSLLVDAGRKVNELDELKETVGSIVEPVSKMMRALEQEKSENIGLRNLLADTRAAFETLRTEFYETEKRAASLEGDNERLRETLELTQQAVRGLESSKVEQTNELASRRTQIADLDRRLAQESAQRQALSEDHSALSDQIAAADKKIVQLESEIGAARENIVLLDDEKHSLQASLDKTVGEVARLSRRLNESENALAAARARLGQVETQIAESDAERNRLAAALEEANERHKTEASTLAMRLESVQSRAATAEKLLAEVRQNLIARTEEVRDFDRKAVEATIARNTAEKKVRQLEASHESQEQQITDLSQARTSLTERNNALTKTLKSRDTALARAEEKIQALTERVGALEAEIQVSNTAVEKRIEELNSTLQRERMERAVAEGALEAARKEHARLQREVSLLKGALRRGLTVEEAETPAVAAPSPAETAEAPKAKTSKSSKGASAEAQAKT